MQADIQLKFDDIDHAINILKKQLDIIYQKLLLKMNFKVIHIKIPKLI